MMTDPWTTAPSGPREDADFPTSCSSADASASKPAALLSDTMLRAMAHLEAAQTPLALWTTMKATAADFGFDRMLVLKWDAASLRSCTPAILHDDTLAGLVDILSAGDHVGRAFAEAKPLSMRDCLDAIDGLIVPVTAHEVSGVVILVGPAPDLSPIARSVLHLLAHFSFERSYVLSRQPKRREVGSLSPRELECLRWAAAGKTDSEIGVILSISARTTRFHIENAKKKLGVATRIQAVAEALRMKAIAA